MTGDLGIPGALHLVWFGLLVPILGIRSRRALAAMPLPPRAAFFRSVIVQQAVFLGFSLLVANAIGLALFPLRPSDVRAWLLAAAILIVAVLLLAPEWRRRVARRDRRVLLVSPTTPRERALWVTLSLVTGVSEEITYRGVLYLLLLALTGSAAAAVAISAVAFAVAHAVQGGRTVAIVLVIAVGFQGLVLLTGSLLPAILVHGLYDAIAGLWYGRLVRRHGFTEPPPAETSPA